MININFRRKLNIFNSKTYFLNTPVSIPELLQFKIGDIIYLSGIIASGRDQVHRRIIEYSHNKISLPKEFELIKGSAIYHMGPIVKEISPNNFKIVSGGPTTSDRMSYYQEEVCKILDIRFVIGKGGMKNISWGAIPAVYLAYPGGAGAIAAKFFEKVLKVIWLDMGPPEASWFFHVEKFGPLVVAIDADGKTLYK
jgi:fumarate hydratase subunit beta